MDLTEQVCSLEYAKKLKELGINQDSLWWWIRYTKNHSWQIVNTNNEDLNGDYSFGVNDLYPAFTVAELINMLPKGYYIYEKALWFEDKVININHYDNDINKGLNYVEAIAKMLIWLIENKHIKPNTQ